MESSRTYTVFWITRLLYFLSVALLFSQCDAKQAMLLTKDTDLPKNQDIKHLKILEVAKTLNMLIDVSIKDSSNLQPYVSSPLTIPPYDSLAPIPLSDNNSPPYCVYPPPNPETPSTTLPTPSSNTPTPPLTTISSPPALGGTTPSQPPSLGGTTPSPPVVGSNPPIIFPGSPDAFPSPSSPSYEPSPPGGIISNPPGNVPSPIGFAPSPPVFEPPVVYPPPTVPPPSSTGGNRGPGVWCVAKPSVPDPIIEEAMNYACGSGADCDPIQSNGPCFEPNTLLAHASYAFNSYWQRTKVAGGTCSFGGTAILVTVDPSSQNCHYINV